MISGLLGHRREHLGGRLSAARAGDMPRSPKVVDLELLEQFGGPQADLGVARGARRFPSPGDWPGRSPPSRAPRQAALDTTRSRAGGSAGRSASRSRPATSAKRPQLSAREGPALAASRESATTPDWRGSPPARQRPAAAYDILVMRLDRAAHRPFRRPIAALLLAASELARAAGANRIRPGRSRPPFRDDKTAADYRRRQRRSRATRGWRFSATLSLCLFVPARFSRSAVRRCERSCSGGRRRIRSCG